MHFYIWPLDIVIFPVWQFFFFTPLGNSKTRNLAGEQRRTLVALPTFKMKGQRWSLVGGGDL